MDRDSEPHGLRRVADFASSLVTWYRDLPVLWQLVVQLSTWAAAGVAAAGGFFGWPTGQSPVVLSLWLAFAILAGAGLVHIAGRLILWRGGLLAPRFFRDLPEGHRGELATILAQEPEAFRISTNVALFQDLAGKGLIRVVAKLASKQVMIRLTPVGRTLVRDWAESRGHVLQGAPTLVDERLIGDLRAIWVNQGATAVGLARDLFRDVQRAVAQDRYWASLLSSQVQSLETAVQALENVMQAENRAGIEKVRDRFNAMYSEYMRAIEWMARIEANGDMPTLSPRPFRKRFEWWQQAHRVFNARLRDLAVQPSHRQTLRIFVLETAHAIERPLLADVLREVERVDDVVNSPQLPDQSSDTP